MSRNWLNLLTNVKSPVFRRHRGTAPCRQPRFQPRIEALEDRQLLSWGVGVQSCIVGDYVGQSGHKNLECVVLDGTKLYHCYRDDQNNWFYTATITTHATDVGSILLGDGVGANGHRDLEVVVPEGGNLNEYIRNPDTGQWNFSATITSTASGPASFTLGDYVSSGLRNRELVVQEGNNLNHYYQLGNDWAWHFGATITHSTIGPGKLGGYIPHNVTGPGSIILGDYVQSNGHANLEVVVQEGSNLTHWYRDANTLQWNFSQFITGNATGPASLVLGPWMASNGHRNLEIVFMDGNGLEHYYRDANTFTWNFSERIDGNWTDPAQGPGSLFVGDSSVLEVVYNTLYTGKMAHCVHQAIGYVPWAMPDRFYLPSVPPPWWSGPPPAGQHNSDSGKDNSAPDDVYTDQVLLNADTVGQNLSSSSASPADSTSADAWVDKVFDTHPRMIDEVFAVL